MLTPASVLTRPPRCAETPRSTGKVAASKDGEAYASVRCASERYENKVRGRFQHPLLGDWNELSHPCAETARIAALDIHDTRPTKSADKAFTRREAGHPSGRGLFDVVRGCGGPRHQMAIIHDIFLAWLQIDLVNGSEAVQNQASLCR